MRRRSSGTLPMLEKAERADMVGDDSGLRASDQDDLAACLLDLLRRDLGERIGRDRDGLGELPVAEDLDAVEPSLDETARDEGRLVDVGAGGEDLEVAHVHLGDLRRERVDEAALGEAALDRRLAAFEVRLEAAHAGVLTLLASSRRLAETRADPAPEARL